MRKSTAIYLRRALCVVGMCSVGGLSGCRSRFVEATIDNQGRRPVRLVEVDYPSAGFGTGTIAAHAQYHYRFKIIGSGSVKISFTDDAGKVHASSGPELDEGQEGSLAITVDEGGGVQWRPALKTPQ